MFSLLALSLALATSSSAPQAIAVDDAELLSTKPAGSVQSIPNFMAPRERDESFHPMGISPASDICYRIRAYIFSKGAHPKLLRETTCGPKAPTARQTDGFKPQFAPASARESGTPDPPR